MFKFTRPRPKSIQVNSRYFILTNVSQNKSYSRIIFILICLNLLVLVPNQ
ncbi:hypothetical protein pb186bvf_015618 [Paramecium bursaria]